MNNKFKWYGRDRDDHWDGMSKSDPERYRKINAVLNEKGKKKDLLDYQGLTTVHTNHTL